MCGIAGIIYSDPGQSCPEEILIKMRDSIVHRGPDDCGIYIKDNIGFSHRRLSIIDLSTGHQPMFDVDAQFCIVFNGEIYNYRELRKELQKDGYKFQTHSDTEVILNLYKKYGNECAKYLNGIFAFAILDIYTKDVFLARDHLGIKPLYYYCDEKVFIFASEIKAIIASGHYRARYNPDKISEYLVFRHVAGNETLFDGIRTLPPGCSMLLSHGQHSLHRYWSNTSTSLCDLNYHDAENELSKLIDDAIHMQMVSDVPLGTFCSGGIDSSLVTAIAALHSTNRINTFSIGFDEAAYDESKYARLVSDKYNTIHHDLRIDNSEFSNKLTKAIWHNDEPLNFANSVHIYALSELAKKNVTVVLTGEGADEIFLGYPRYIIPKAVDKLSRLPKSIFSLIKLVNKFTKDHRAQRVLELYNSGTETALLYNNGTYIDTINDKLNTTLPPNFKEKYTLLSQISPDTPISTRAALLDQSTYLLSILNRQDKMSMAASIESRVPFLDYRIVEFANNLPERYKLKGLTTKNILKKIAVKYLPKEVVYRRKSGFGVPLSQWMRDEQGLGAMLDRILDNKLICEYVGKKDLCNIIETQRNGSADNSEVLWPLLNLAVWCETFNL